MKRTKLHRPHLRPLDKKTISDRWTKNRSWTHKSMIRPTPPQHINNTRCHLTAKKCHRSDYAIVLNNLVLARTLPPAQPGPVALDFHVQTKDWPATLRMEIEPGQSTGNNKTLPLSVFLEDWPFTPCSHTRSSLCTIEVPTLIHDARRGRLARRARSRNAGRRIRRVLTSGSQR